MPGADGSASARMSWAFESGLVSGRRPTGRTGRALGVGILSGVQATAGERGRTLDDVSTVDLSDEVVREFVAEFGDDAPQVAEKALRGEITRHRIERSVRDGTDPAEAVAAALAKDTEFTAEVERIDTDGEQPSGDLAERLRRSAA